MKSCITLLLDIWTLALTLWELRRKRWLDLSLLAYNSLQSKYSCFPQTPFFLCSKRNLHLVQEKVTLLIPKIKSILDLEFWTTSPLVFISTLLGERETEGIEWFLKTANGTFTWEKTLSATVILIHPLLWPTRIDIITKWIQKVYTPESRCYF